MKIIEKTKEATITTTTHFLLMEFPYVKMDQYIEKQINYIESIVEQLQ